MDVLERLKSDIVLILCKLEKKFPPAFFDLMIHLSIHLVEEAMLGGPVQYRWMYQFERYMKVLKGYVRNNARPEGSIAEGYMDNECMTFCSMYFDGIETRFNRAERNYEGETATEEGSGLPIFSQNARGLGAAKYDELNLKELAMAQLYVLNNCEEVYPYIEQHKEELERQSNQNIEKRHKSEFQKWFLEHVTRKWKEGSEGVTSQLLNLARGPNPRVTHFNGCLVKGYRFHTQEREMHLKSQNSGVVVKGDYKGESIDFYGVVSDVIELSYLGGNHIMLFRCDWWDVGSARGILVDDYNFTSVNVSKTWYANEPFVLACQVEQVFYLKDTVNGENWRVVQKIVPRAIYDIPEEEEEEEQAEEEDEPYQEDEPYGFGNRVEVDDQPIMMNRDDMDFVSVDVDEQMGVEEEEDDCDAFINDDDEMNDVQASDDELLDEDDMSIYSDSEDEL